MNAAWLPLSPSSLRHALRPLGLALAFVVVPLASPLLLSLGLILAGILVAYRAAAEMLPQGAVVPTEHVVFRHFL